MIRAQVKHIWTTGMDVLELHPPADLECFCIAVRAMVGPQDQSGEESFDILVCTPEWVTQQVRKEGFVLGKGHLIVENFDVQKIKSLVTNIIERWSAESWPELALKLTAIGYWEFE